MAPKEKKENAHNGKQGNATRLELFIALQYLLEKCPDKEHTSKTVELEQYADEKFNVLLDRRRANDIFANLAELTKDNPTVLPYKVMQVGDKSRFYIEKCLFNEREIESIAKAIRNDSSIGKTRAEKYIDAFISKTCNPSQKERINNKLKRTDIVKPRISDIQQSNIEYLERIRDESLRFYFKVNRFVSFGDFADKININTFRKNNATGYNAGIVYDVIPINKKQIDVCIYLPDLTNAVIVHMDDIIVDQTREPTEQWGGVNYKIGNGSTELIDWFKNYYKGVTGIVTDITFKFHIGLKQQILKARKKTFREFFKEDMQYELVERTVERRKMDGTVETLVVQDAIAKVSCNFHAFRKWYWEASDKPYENTVVLSPASMNDRLLALITERFQRRLDKYGLMSENGKEERERIEQARKRYLQKEPLEEKLEAPKSKDND